MSHSEPSSEPDAARYRIYGAEPSPYSVKVRSYFRYKGLPHDWIVRDSNTQADYQKRAKLPIIPLVITPADEALQDSTPILEKIEAESPDPSIHPPDPVARFVSALLEEFGDEWGNKWMFHYRWAREVDQNAASRWLVRTMMPGIGDEQLEQMAGGIKQRMLGRVWFVGSNDVTAPQIEASFEEGLGQLERHLEGRAYLFGDRPAFADFGLWGQVYNAWCDPTAGAIVKRRAPATCGWIERMLEPKGFGDFEPWAALGPTLEPFLERQVGARFLPWSDANAAALAAGHDEFSVELVGETWTQKPQKYHAKSLGVLRQRYADVADTSQLDPVLERTGCLRWLRS